MPEVFNASDWLLDRHVRAGAGDRVALICGAERITYADLLSRVRASAEGLRQQGIRPEERVVLALPDTPALVTAFLACLRIGAVAVPVSTLLTAADLAGLTRDARARVAIVSADLPSVAAGLRAGAPEVSVLLDAPPEAPGDGAAYATWADSPAFWLYTSGTTGTPKAAMHRHGALRDTAETYAAHVLSIGPDDRCLSVASVFFAYGLGNSITFPLSVGAASVLDPAAATPVGVAEIGRRERPTLLFAVPTFYAALLAADVPDDAFASVRQGVSAGEALPAEVFRRFRDRFGVEVLDGIGSTEALHIFLSNRPGDIRAGSSGRPVPGYALQLLDDDGAPVADDKPGHLYVSGSSVATGYWCQSAATRQAFQGEWLRTGDVYCRSAEGYYTYQGRSDDMLKAAGFWVSPTEVEAILLEHPDVYQVAVVGSPDADGIERPVACVVPEPGQQPSEGDLIAFTRDRLAGFKRPMTVFLLESLPTGPTGKVLRYRLRAQLGRPVQA